MIQRCARRMLADQSPMDSPRPPRCPAAFSPRSHLATRACTLARLAASDAEPGRPGPQAASNERSLDRKLRENDVAVNPIAIFFRISQNSFILA